MDTDIKRYFNGLQSADKNVQYEAYNQIMNAARENVDWAYEVWDGLKNDLTHKDNHSRSRAAQFLSYLAISDQRKGCSKTFRRYGKLQKIKNLSLPGILCRPSGESHLQGRSSRKWFCSIFQTDLLIGIEEKNYTLMRFDIIQALRNLFDESKEEKVKQLALDLIKREEDPKYKKKYAGVWKNA